MGIETRFNAFQSWLKSWPNAALSLALVALALALLYIAARGTALEKAIAMAWVVFP